MSTSLKWSLGLLGLFLLLCCGGGIFLVNSAKKAVDDIAGDALKVGDTILATVAKDWNLADLKAAATTEFSIDPVKLTEWRDQLGAYESGASRMEGISAKSNTGEENRVEVQYVSDAKFAKGTAVVRMQLVRIGGSAFKVNTFDVKPAGASPVQSSE